MITSEELHLVDVIDISVLQNVQRKLSNLVDVSVVTVDAEGKPVGNLNNFTSFCDLIRSTEVGAKRCMECDAKAEKKAFRQNKSISYDCSFGLKDCCVPIIVEGKLLGAVLGGQVLVCKETDTDPRQSIDVDRISSELNINKESLQETVNNIAVVEEQYLQDCIDFYEVIANYLIEMGMKSIAQQKLLKESNEKLEFEKRLKNAELKTIEAQINPHFLFNTLNSIARIALTENAEMTEEMIYNLSDLLRYNLRQTEEFPTLESELANIQRYLYIQKTRYQERLDYEIITDDSINRYCIPNMILQPIVENAIIHGIEPLLKGGKVIISVKKVNDTIILDVSDTGIGIPNFIKKSILKFSTEKKHPGLGVNNSHLRIKDHFGNPYGLTFENFAKYSTTVRITFPAFTDIKQFDKSEGIINDY